MQTIELEYTPRHVQFEIHNNLRRFNVIVAHRRMGKTVLCINQLISEALKCKKKNPRYAYIAPLYKQAKSVSWDYLKEFTRPIPGVKINESELRVDLPNGARISLYGADNYDSLRGIYLDGVILDEYAQMAGKAWTEVIRPTLSDRHGWAIFIGTPKGHNAFYNLYKQAQEEDDWFAGMYKASETGIVSEYELDSARRGMTQAEFEQEYECSFEAAIQGAVYAEEMQRAQNQNRICKVPYEPDLPVSTAWDLGFDDSTSIIFYQTVGKEIRIFDCEEHFGAKLEFYATLLKEKGYNYEMHHLPHDANIKTLQGGGVSIQEQLWELGVTNTNIVPKQGVEHGIQKTRSLFPRFWIDNSNERTKHLVECLLQYHYEYDEDRAIFKQKPDHDWSSHNCDAIRMLAVGFQEEYFDDDDSYAEDLGGRLG